jgi:hypothetical protein
MNRELIDYNSALGMRTWLESHPDDPEGVVVRREFSGRTTQKIIDANKIAANHLNTGKMEELEHVASIPVAVMYEWLTKYGVDAWKYSSCEETRRRVNRLLNDSEYRYLKVRNIII